MGTASSAGRKPATAKSSAAKPASPRKTVAVTLKGGAQWKEWLQGLSDHCRLDVAKVIDRSLVEFAKREGYEPPPPLR
jgi:hypothetical protein